MNHRIGGRGGIDEERITSLLDRGDDVVVQYHVVHDAKEPLDEIDRLCSKHGPRLEVRFWGSFGETFDGRILRQIPSVRALRIDPYQATHLDEVGSLGALERLGLCVHFLEQPSVLAPSNLRNLTHLSVHAPERGISLEPIRRMQRLTYLGLGAFGKELATIAEVRSLEHLSLTSVPRAVPLDFVNALPRLSRLYLGFGSREDLDEVSNPGIETLELLRVRGLARLKLDRFKELKRIAVNDQPRLQSVDLRANEKLADVYFQNCRALEKLLGVRDRPRLREIVLGRTAIDLEALIDAGLPPSLKVARLYSGKRKLDDGIQARLEALGVGKVSALAANVAAAF